MDRPRPMLLPWIYALALIAAVAWIDFRTGYEISVFVLYLFPVAYGAWTLGRWPGIGLGLICTACWRWADFASGHTYSQAWIAWERTINPLVMFSFIAFSFDFFRRSQERDRQRLRDLETILPICTVCHRIKNEQGQWVDFEVHLREHVKAASGLPRCECPDCAGAKYMTDITL